MNFDQFNEKSKLIIDKAQKKAVSLNHQHITVEHLAFAIIDDNDSYLKDILKKCNSNSISSILSEIEIELNKLPSVSGSNLNIFFSNEVINIFESSKKVIVEFNDSFISGGFIFIDLALASITNSANLSVLFFSKDIEAAKNS